MDSDLAIIQNLIYETRGCKVMLDSDLAKLYGVEVKRLNESVKRNIQRFPEDFMFRLSDEEWQNLRSQIATFGDDSRKYKPYAFTEHGVLMLSNVLNSPQAVDVSIKIIRAFNRLRQYALAQNTPSKALDELKTLLLLHVENADNRFNKHDEAIRAIVSVLNDLIEKPRDTKQIGFDAER